MAKGVESQQLANSGTAQNLSNNLTANASNIYGGLEPTLQAEAAHPQGYTPTQLANMNTAAMQSAGGSQAGAVGQGGLLAARTRNAGAAQNAVGAGTRHDGQNLSNAAVGTQLQNANLQQKQQQAGISGLGGLYNTELTGGETALGLSNQALSGANTTAGNNIWDKLLLQGQSNGNQAAMAAAE